MKRIVNGKEHELEPASGVEVKQLSDRLMVRSAGRSHSALAVRKGNQVHVSYKGRTYVVEPPSFTRGGDAGGATGDLTAPLPGTVVDVMTAEGDEVTAGQKLMILEAMKMQQPITAPFDGKVTALKAAKGDQVSEGQTLVHVEPVE